MAIVQALAAFALAAQASSPLDVKTLAAAANPAPATDWACQPAGRAKVEADAALVNRVMSAPASLPSEMAALTAVMEHAPPGPLPVAVRCPDRIVVFSSDLAPLIMAAGAPKTGDGGTVNVEGRAPLPYPRAALLVGSGLDTQGRYGEAISILRRGLMLSPGDGGVSAELAFALNQAHRPSEAVGVVDAALAGPGAAAPKLAALLHRARGYALGDLGRFDEAIADYRASQSLDPTERVSANEIVYLEGRKGGRGSSPAVVFTADKASNPPSSQPEPAKP